MQSYFSKHLTSSHKLLNEGNESHTFKKLLQDLNKNHRMSKTNTSHLVLAIYPNSRGFGYALMDGIHTHIASGIVDVSPLKNPLILKRAKMMINYFKPTIVVLRNHRSKFAPLRSKRLIRLIEKITWEAEKQGLKVFHYRRTDIRTAFEQFNVQTKYEIAQKIIEGFPELKSREPKVRKFYMTEDYHMGVFDAVALAITHYCLNE